MQVTDLEPRVNDGAFTYYPRLSRVAEYATAHVTDRLTLGDVAEVVGLEKKYFSAFFRSKVGVTWTEWLRLLRVARAVDRIEVGELPIPRLAFAAGFHDVRTFERAFKRYLGVPPMVYKAGARPEARVPPHKSRTVPRGRPGRGR